MTYTIDALENLARDRLSKARALLGARIITPDEYADVVDAMRLEVNLPALPPDRRAELVKIAEKIGSFDI